MAFPAPWGLLEGLILTCFLLGGVAAGLPACGDDSPASSSGNGNGDGNGDGSGGGPTIAPGLVGGACLEGNACLGEEVFCYGGICREPACRLGEEGCACYANSTCNRNGDGTWMMCEDGLCRPPSCPQGGLGCGCRQGGTCDAGLFCDDTSGSPRCEMADCAVGDEGCGCLPDRSCGASEDGTLICDGALCVPADCQVGSGDCACNPDYSCEPGLACGEDGRCGPANCPRGDLGCGCLADGACNGASLFCGTDGVCQATTCTQGEIGCGCFADFTCSSLDGGWLAVCAEGRCVAAPCEPGEEGCGCMGDGGCDDAGLTCQEGYCVSVGCTPGAIGCVCSAGACGDGAFCSAGLCVEGTGQQGEECFANGTCETGLLCDEGTCVPCALGTTECACFGNETCVTGLSCIAGQCIPDSVIAPEPPENPVCYSPCSAGLTLTDGSYIACSADGLMEYCLEGTACVEGSCIPVAVVPNTEPDPTECDTPAECPEDYPNCSPDGVCYDVLDPVSCDSAADCPGEFPNCDAEEEVCYDELNECDSQLDCPEYQTCIEGLCYSQCEYDSDCGPGLSCHLHVCQIPCLASEEPCPPGNTCVTQDGEAGYCNPTPNPTGDPVTTVPGDFAVFPPTVALSNVRDRAALTIANLSDVGYEFTVRKLQHVELTDAGPVTETDPAFALTWLEMGAADPTPNDPSTTEDDLTFEEQQAIAMEALADGDIDTVRDHTITFFVEAHSVRVFVLAEAANPDVSTWNGTLSIESPLGTKQVSLTFASLPEGQWTGTAYYFGNFRDRNFHDFYSLSANGIFLGLTGGWLNNRNNQTVADLTGNALISRWVAFRTQPEAWTLEHLTAIIQATTSGSWTYPSVEAVCEDARDPDNPNQVPACVLFDNDAGYLLYAADQSNTSPPSGVVQLPMSLNLREDPSSASFPAEHYVGRINSDVALHWAGYPEFDLTFERSPLECTHGGNSCVLDVERGLAATVQVGARFPAPESGACPAGFELVDIPHLVDGFREGTTLDASTGQRYTHECRDALLPWGSSFAADNASLAGANPIPDGRTLERRIEVIDGMLVNQTTLLLLFYESYPSFIGADLAGADEEAPLSAYGLMVLSRSPATLADADYVGFPALTHPTYEPPGLAVACSEDLLWEVLGPAAFDASGAEALSASEVQALAGVLINGRPDDSGLPDPVDPSRIHYFCEDTGTFDYGPDPDNPIPCPVGSRIEYFALNTDWDQDFIDGQACQASVQVERLPFTIGARYTLPGGDSCEPGSSPYCTPEAAMAKVLSREPVIVVEQPGTCQQRLNQWRTALSNPIRTDLVWYCEGEPDPVTGEPRPLSLDGPALDCDAAVRLNPAESFDLRRGKLFYDPAGTVGDVAFLPPLQSEVDDAFRYKVRFRNRSGQSIGFVPEICIPNSDQIPYCYDPTGIERVRERVDCAIHLYLDHYDQLAAHNPTRQMVEDFLEVNFSFESARARCEQLGGSPEFCEDSVPATAHFDGFERLNAELLVMLGDDAFTRALGSRFDLAGTSLARFEGDLFEPDGMGLSGGAGYEMHLLYQSAQYYQMVLDRFYSLSNVFWDVENATFIGAETVTSYLERMVLASTKLTRVWNEVARRYQSFNRPDLARLVIERSYTRAYLESIALARVMLRIGESDLVLGAEFPQIRRVIDDAQRAYRIAMLDMTEAYQSITNDVNYFGFSPDYIPFPGLRETDPNAVRLLLDRAMNAVQIAAQRENTALDSNRSFDTDSAQFQAELARVATEYEDQLAEICGTFRGTDGNIYPAIPIYNTFFDAVSVGPTLPPLVGDPCGTVGNGAIHAARLGQFQQMTALEGVIQAYENAMAEIDLVRVQTAQRCGLFYDQADWEAQGADRIIQLDEQIRDAQAVASNARRTQERALSSISSYVAVESSCNPSESTSIGVSAGVSYTFGGAPAISAGVSASWGSSYNPSACMANTLARSTTQLALSASHTTQASSEAQIRDAELETSMIQRNLAFNRVVSQCDFAALEATGQVRRLWLRMKELEIQMIQQQYAVELAEAELAGLRNRELRLLAQMEEAEQLLINVEAARNDPNVRIYRNAAVIRADRSFYDALRAVYRATRVFEFYSSQSYARMDELFLMRMVAHGELNLEDYLIELENAFFDFEETFGVPDTRVEVVSLRDDILAIPRISDDQTPYSQSERIQLMRDALTDVNRLDRNGYLTIPFSTSVDQLSPVTRNHKIAYIEAELIGSDLGDTVGRVYLRQRGTSTVRSVDGGKQFYAFPDITAVLNPFFNGQRVFDPTVYRNNRLRDRPFANTQWEIVINQRDESVNQDINLNSLTDVRLYIYYTDFTEL